MEDFIFPILFVASRKYIASADVLNAMGYSNAILNHISRSSHFFSPKGKYPDWQTEMGTTGANILQNFSGQTSGSNPPDCNGTVGPDHYMQTINVKYTIYDKLGSLVAGPTNLNTLFSGVPGATQNDGDPVILYDDQADRYMVAEFSGIWSNPDYMLIAISQTNDPTGLWDRWSFVMNGFPDYMKFGIWNDGYYMGTNTSSGNDIYVFERAAMLSGSSNPKMLQLIILTGLIQDFIVFFLLTPMEILLLLADQVCL